MQLLKRNLGKLPKHQNKNKTKAQKIAEIKDKFKLIPTSPKSAKLKKQSKKRNREVESEVLPRSKKQINKGDQSVESVDSDCSDSSSGFHMPRLNISIDETDPIHEEVIQHLARTMALRNQSSINSDASTEEPHTSDDQQQTSVKNTPVNAELQNMEVESNDTSSPQAMSLASIYQMFIELKNEITTLKDGGMKVEISSIKEECVKHAVETVSHDISLQSSKVREIEKKLAQCMQQNEILSEVVDRMHTQYMDVVQRLDNLEINNAKLSISISGLQVSGRKDEWKLQVIDFVFQQLGVEIDVEDIYQLGRADPKLLIVTVGSAEQKKAVLEHKSYLKDVRVKGKAVYINDYVPLQLQERRRREREIVQQIHSENIEGVEAEYIKGGLAICGQLYKKKITVPTPKELIQLTTDELETVLKMETFRGARITQERSIFTGYTAPVQNYQQIRKLYMKMKLIQPEARHIPCAYWLPNEEIPYSTDYFDDEEHGAGRAIMDLMKKFQLKGRAIFVARKYGGVRMGTDRFECYVEAAKGSVMSDPSVKIDFSNPPVPAFKKEKNQQQEEKNEHSQAIKHSLSGRRGTNTAKTQRANYRAPSHQQFERSYSQESLTHERQFQQYNSAPNYYRPRYRGGPLSRSSRSSQRRAGGYRQSGSGRAMYPSRYSYYNPRGRNLLEHRDDSRSGRSGTSGNRDEYLD